MQQTVFQYARLGFRFTVYPDRIETSTAMRLGPLPLRRGQQRSIPLRAVTGVEVGGARRQLRVRMSDGREERFNLGTQAEVARQAIADALARVP